MPAYSQRDVERIGISTKSIMYEFKHVSVASEIKSTKRPTNQILWKWQLQLNSLLCYLLITLAAVLILKCILQHVSFLLIS